MKAWFIPTLIVLLAGATLAAIAPAAAEFSPYPVRNGDFERLGGWGLPQHWRWHVVRGEHTYSHATDPATGGRFVEIRTTSGLARVYQTGIRALAGTYRLAMRSRGTGAGHVLVTGEETKASFDRALPARAAGQKNEAGQLLEPSRTVSEQASRLSRMVAEQMIPYASTPTERHIVWLFNKALPSYEAAQRYLDEVIAIHQAMEP